MALSLKDIAPVLKSGMSFTETQFLTRVTDDLEGVWAGLQRLLTGELTYAEDVPEVRLKAGYLNHCARLIYRYAYDGIFPERSEDIDSVDAAFLDFAFFTGIARHACEMYDTASAKWSEQTLAVAILRARLDAATLGAAPDVVILEPDHENFTLFEVAVLAQMHEKSVRNATHVTSGDRLQTIRVGTRSLVEPAKALRWLSNRRSFTPTTLPAKEDASHA